MAERDYNSVFKQGVSAEDIQRAKAAFWKKMRQFAGRVPFARQATALYYLIRDPKMNLGVKATAVLAILYFISPVDAIPDFIPVTGMLDDATVIASALTILGPLMTPFLKRADEWIRKGKPLQDEPEVVIDVAVTQHAVTES
jgi:uncharacterized membrane protein YkvA (DUF1232 family)